MLEDNEAPEEVVENVVRRSERQRVANPRYFNNEFDVASVSWV